MQMQVTNILPQVEHNVQGEIGLLQVLMDRVGTLGFLKSVAETLENTVLYALEHKIFSKQTEEIALQEEEEKVILTVDSFINNKVQKEGDMCRIQIRAKGLTVGLNRGSDIFICASFSEFQYHIKAEHSGAWSTQVSQK